MIDQGEGTIEITRRHRAWGSRFRELDVLIDHGRVGTLRDGEHARYPVRSGLHEVQLRLDSTSSRKVKVDVAPGRTVQLECRARNPFVAANGMSLGRDRHIELRVIDA